MKLHTRKYGRRKSTLLQMFALSLGAMAACAFASPGDQLAKLLPSDGSAGEYFSGAVAMKGPMALVGAARDGQQGTNAGAAYLFDVSDPGNPVQLSKLLASDGSAGHKFGHSVGLGGLPGHPVAVVGAMLDNSAYLFDISDPANPIQSAKITGDGTGGKFGYSMAVNGVTAIISAYWNGVNGSLSGKVYIFDISDPYNPIQRSILFPANGTAGDEFGNAISINGSLALIGAWASTRGGISSGSAYLFSIADPSNPIQLAELVPGDGAPTDLFGASVAINTILGSPMAVVGSMLDDDMGQNSGSAYRFDLADPTHPNLVAKLYPSDPETEKRFGASVAMNDQTIIVGAKFDNTNGSHSGSAYLFDARSGFQIAKMTPSDGAAGDQFGLACAISGTIAIVSCPFGGGNGIDSGSAYLFATPGPCSADLNRDGVLDFFDVAGFLQLFAIEDDRADWNADGVFDFFDVAAFLSAFSGCP